LVGREFYHTLGEEKKLSNLHDDLIVDLNY